MSLTPPPSLPPLVSSISPDMRSAVLDELNRIAVEHDVKFLFAVESGGRAWGFPSPDSDYDVRFVYTHKIDWYLSVFPGRDVIERPISDTLDISGWDVRKALGLMLKPNPVMYEWLSSPIRYLWNDAVCEKLIAFSKRPAHSSACLYHYLNLGQRQFDQHLARDPTVNLKKYFYVLRPALAIRWMRLRPEVVPPMNIQALVSELDIAPALLEIIADLIRRKAILDETEVFHRIPELDQFIKEEFEWASQVEKRKVPRNLNAEADALLRDILHSLNFD